MQQQLTHTAFKVKISSKNQLTLPVLLLKQMGWQSGQVFSVISNPKNNQLTFSNSQDTFNKIQNRLKKYKVTNITVDEAIEYTKKHYQKQRYTKYED